MASADIGCWGQVSFIDDMGAPLPDDTAVIQREIEETAARGATPEVLAVRMRIYPSTVLVSQDAIAAVGGASYTSPAFKDSLADAIRKAGL